MKRLFVVAFVLSSFILLVCCAGTLAGKSNTKKIYTACNIWVYSNMRCINFKMGKFIPAGTELSYTGVISDQSGDYVYFKVAGSKKKYRMGFNSMWHPGKTAKDYKNYLFTEKTFDELVKDMPGKDIDAIKRGKVVVGMSKKAVLVSYGRPPEHRTPAIKMDEWRYWMNKRKQKVICFQNGLALRCSDLKKLQEKSTDDL